MVQFALNCRTIRFKSSSGFARHSCKRRVRGSVLALSSGGIAINCLPRRGYFGCTCLTRHIMDNSVMFSQISWIEKCFPTVFDTTLIGHYIQVSIHMSVQNDLIPKPFVTFRPRAHKLPLMTLGVLNKVLFKVIGSVTAFRQAFEWFTAHSMSHSVLF